MMTLNEVYRKGVSILKQYSIDSPNGDAIKIFEAVFNLNRQQLILRSNDIADEAKTSKFLSYIEKRKNKIPLQYILGKWEFMENEYKVGEGVLIPREDTSAAVNLALELLPKAKKLDIIDLCSGSGIIAITLAKKLKNSRIFALEVSKKAYSFLLENISLNKVNNVKPLLADLYSEHKNFKRETFDLIISNPPYIAEDEMKDLQPEVKNEPVLALCGGKEGLDFYKAIAKLWKNSLKKNSLCIVEIGIHQENDIIAIFENEGFSFKTLKKDINNIIRALAFEYKKTN